jgi:L-alanine-DL-glutamate epimerase-like enolase superfamily enzyme
MPDSQFPDRPRIVRAEAIHVRVPFRRPLLDATGEFTHRRTWLLRLVDERGNEGLGEAALNPIAAVVPSLAAGWMPEWSELAGEGEPGRAAMAAIDGALAALKAVQGWRSGAVVAPQQVPVATTIPVSAAIPFAGPDAGAEAAAQAVELGFGTLKLRAGFERATDQLVDRLRAIRAAVGPEPRLRIDAGGAWDLDTATERISAIEPFRIEFVEQPLAAWDIAGHAALRERVRAPIALDESIDSEGSARAALAEGAADVVVVKPARVGGLAATMRVVDAARAARAFVVLGTYFETGVGIGAALRIAAAIGAAERGPEPAHGLATGGVLVHDLLGMPLPIEQGRMAVPAWAALDEDEVARYVTERFEVRG